ncbi:MAG: hypothetical protein KF685_11995 [Acidobacteria bacterium]|nr:hypothetical protein [Acidobacteriota bacterium]
MKNKISFLVVLGLLTAAVLGCGGLNPFSGGGDSETSSNRSGSNSGKSDTISDKAVDVAVGEEKIGIPECDAVVDELVGQTKSKNDDEGYVAKAFRQYWENMIREAIRKSVEENKNDPEKLATECRKIMVQLEKFKKEEEAKKAEQ